jgi:hypothetical protein
MNAMTPMELNKFLGQKLYVLNNYDTLVISLRRR